MPSLWVQALKEWNDKKGGAYCIPRKPKPGYIPSPEYREVKSIMNRLKENEVKNESAKKVAKSMIEESMSRVKTKVAEEQKKRKQEEGAVEKLIASTTAKRTIQERTIPRAIEKIRSAKTAK